MKITLWYNQWLFSIKKKIIRYALTKNILSPDCISSCKRKDLFNEKKHKKKSHLTFFSLNIAYDINIYYACYDGFKSLLYKHVYRFLLHDTCELLQPTSNHMWPLFVTYSRILHNWKNNVILWFIKSILGVNLNMIKSKTIYSLIDD